MQGIIQTVTSLTCNLADISTREGIDLRALTRVWATLPIEDSEEMTYLEAAGQCILQISSLVDDRYPNLTKDQRIAKKFRLMASLLNAKADLLVNLYNPQE